MEDKLKNNYYEKYIGQYVKRFYTRFIEDEIFKITNFKLHRYPADAYDIETDVAFFEYEDKDGNRWWADVEDSVIITNEQPIVEDERVANVNDLKYHGYDPFTQTIIQL